MPPADTPRPAFMAALPTRFPISETGVNSCLKKKKKKQTTPNPKTLPVNSELKGKEIRENNRKGIWKWKQEGRGGSKDYKCRKQGFTGEHQAEHP